MDMQCDNCFFHVYDDEASAYFCEACIDQDELYRLQAGRARHCPYYRPDDDYAIVRKQN